MDLDTAKNISQTLLKANLACRGRLQKGAQARLAAQEALKNGVTPAGIRSEFIRGSVQAVVKLLGKSADDFNGAQTEIRVSMQDLQEVLTTAGAYIKKRAK